MAKKPTGKSKAGLKQTPPSKPQNQKQVNKQSINKIKKDKNVFKLSNSKNNKKTKAVPINLKKLNVKQAQEKSDKKLKELHVDLVSKKSAIKIKKNEKKKAKRAAAKAAISSKQVAADITKMQV